MISLSLKNILIISVVLAIIYFIIKKNDVDDNTNETPTIDPNQYYQQPPTQTDNFWTSIIANGNTMIYQYQLPNYFDINPKYLMYHPNFTVQANKMIQIVSENEPEAVAMLNLWVALNKGLLDNEEDFSKLFDISIKRAITYPSVTHKFKIEINNMVYSHFNENKPENLEFTEDLAPSIENNNQGQLEEQNNQTTLLDEQFNQVTPGTQGNPINNQIDPLESFGPINSFDSNMSSI